MKDREYDFAKFETELKNDELEREWYLWKLGRRGELLNAERQGAQNTNEAATQAQRD